MVAAAAKHRVIMIDTALTQGQVIASHAVRKVDILDIVPDIAALYMEILDVRHRHDHNVAVKLHHKDDELLLGDIIRL